MGQLSAKLRSIENGVAFWCPGCREAHHIRIAPPNPWGWNGDVNAPTFSPSVLITSGHYVSTHKPGDPCWCTYNEKQKATGGRLAPFKCKQCHSFVEGGRIRFLDDCSHELRGQTVPLPDLPMHMRDGATDFGIETQD